MAHFPYEAIWRVTPCYGQAVPKPPQKKPRASRRVAASTASATGAVPSRLGRQDWIKAALHQIAEQGLLSVTIAGLASHLGVTSGSFYWHFSSRDEIIEAALDHWETERIDVIEGLREISDPTERLERLVTQIYKNRDRGALFAALQASSTDPRVGSRLRRTTQRRLTFLAQTYRELGYPMTKARHCALVLYSLYTGLWEVTRTLPASDENAPVGERLSDYVQHLRSVILPTRPSGTKAD